MGLFEDFAERRRGKWNLGGQVRDREALHEHAPPFEEFRRAAGLDPTRR